MSLRMRETGERNYVLKRIIHSGILILLMCISFIMPSCRSKKESKTAPATSVSHSKVKVVAEKLNIPEKEVQNKKLYMFISEWYGTPYRYGGCSKEGTDCSCFTGTLYQKVYGKTLARSAKDMHKECSRVKESNLREGDLLFFKIGSKEITHVGVFLKERKFVHASTKKGVMISDLDEEFFKKVFYEAGRLK
jgi:murein DD-endopeptidase / murein LD-carboxypeptidase